jgi:hypothetical protein
MPPSNATPSCLLGVCGFSCVSPFIQCNGACVDTKSDVRHCGGCNQLCPQRPNATPECTPAGCDFVCDAGYSKCGANCVNTNTDKQNCGQCNLSCKGNKMCVAGACQ